MQQTSPLIVNETALDEDVPPSRDNIVARDAEFETLELALRPIERGEGIESLLVDGPKGTGKSHCVRIMLDELDAEFGGFDYLTLSCHQVDSRTKILAHALAEVSDRSLPALRNKPVDKLQRLLGRAVSRPFMVVLDEADSLGDDALKALSDLDAIGDCKPAVIVNDADGFRDTVRPSLASCFENGYPVTFGAYSVPELVEILQLRADYGLRDGVVAPRDLEAIAQRAHENGSARLAIVTLRKAVKAAATAGRDRVHAEDIEAAEPAARKLIRQKDYDLLSEPQQQLVNIVESYRGEWVSCATVKREYLDAADDPVSDGHRRRCLRKVRDYGFIDQRGTTKDAEYRYIELNAE